MSAPGLAEFFEVDLVLATSGPRFLCPGIWSECGGTVAAQIVADVARADHTGAMLQREDMRVIGNAGEFMRVVTRTPSWHTTGWISIGVAMLALAGTATRAQTATPPPLPAAIAPPPAAAAPKSAAKPRECTLSDIQLGKDKTIEVARLRLDEYVAKVGKQRGWKSWDKSLETIACEDYLYVPLLGQEYKCLVTATFCKKS
jgi:hypothetical protein